MQSSGGRAMMFHTLRTTLTQTRRECVIILLLSAYAWLMVRSRADTCECQNRGVKVSAKPCIHCLQTAVFTDLQAHKHAFSMFISKPFGSRLNYQIVFFFYLFFDSYLYVYLSYTAKTKNKKRKSYEYNIFIRNSNIDIILYIMVEYHLSYSHGKRADGPDGLQHCNSELHQYLYIIYICRCLSIHEYTIYMYVYNNI